MPCKFKFNGFNDWSVNLISSLNFIPTAPQTSPNRKMESSTLTCWLRKRKSDRSRRTCKRRRTWWWKISQSFMEKTWRWIKFASESTSELFSSPSSFIKIEISGRSASDCLEWTALVKRRHLRCWRAMKRFRLAKLGSTGSAWRRIWTKSTRGSVTARSSTLWSTT